MRTSATLFTAVLLLLLGANAVAQGDNPLAAKDLTQIRPPGGVPISPGLPGEPIRNEFVKKATQRLEAAPEADMAKWVGELERVMARKFDGRLENQACRTYFVSRVSLAFDDLQWNARGADRLFQRLLSMPSPEAIAWEDAFESLLKKQLQQVWGVPLVLIPVEALHQEGKYSTERGRKYLARLKQLSGEDVSLWRGKADRFEGTELDAAVNIILLDDYFDNEEFQREKLKAAIAALKK